MNVFISVIDPSARLYISKIVPYMDCDIFSTSRGIGKTVVNLDEISVVGMPSLREAFLKLIETMRFVSSCKIDIAVLCDSPDFNIILGLFLRRMKKNIRIKYFIPPAVWAWRPERKDIVERNFDTVIYVLPFEGTIWTKNGIYVGHPICKILREELTLWKRGEMLGPSFGVADGRSSEKKRRLAFLPGSRISELKQHAELIDGLWRAFEEFDILVPTKYYWFFPRRYRVVPSTFSRWVMYCSDFTVSASGTATLEAALLGKPCVVFYKLPPLTLEIARRLVRVPFISLPNIILGKRILPELIQDEVDPARIRRELENLDITEFPEVSRKLYELLDGMELEEIAEIMLS